MMTTAPPREQSETTPRRPAVEKSHVIVVPFPQPRRGFSDAEHVATAVAK